MNRYIKAIYTPSSIQFFRFLVRFIALSLEINIAHSFLPLISSNSYQFLSYLSQFALSLLLPYLTQLIFFINFHFILASCHCFQLNTTLRYVFIYPDVRLLVVIASVFMYICQNCKFICYMVFFIYLARLKVYLIIDIYYGSQLLKRYVINSSSILSIHSPK